ncbi:MAG: DinB family protein, partial [Anaerolineales bacterium]|nr:DinB family protein [Anaerolineales bacterium]
VAAAEKEALAPRLRRILEEDQHSLDDWDETRWMEENYDPERDVEAWLAMFESARNDLTPRLNALELDAWNRTGRHPYRGDRTLLWWLEYAVQHTRDHLEQLGAEHP